LDNAHAPCHWKPKPSAPAGPVAPAAPAGPAGPGDGQHIVFVITVSPPSEGGTVISELFATPH